MAEARLGVDPMRTLRRAGYEVDTSTGHAQINVSRRGIVLYIPHPRFLWRTAAKAVRRGFAKVRLAFAPAPLWGVAVFVGAFTAHVCRQPSTSWLRSGRVASWVWAVDSRLPSPIHLGTTPRVCYLATFIACGAAYGFGVAQRFVLRSLLQYTGWVADRKSMKTKVWGAIVKTFYVQRYVKQLFAFQGALPTLPLPSVRDTCERYFESVRPLMGPEEEAEHKKEMERFINEESKPLQRRLWLKWLMSRNYVSDWWLKLVYLRSRSSLCINSNWYGIEFANYTPTRDQASRAAVAVYAFMKIKQSIDNETFQPQLMGGVAPVCMAQYQYIFSTTRIPGAEQDTLESYSTEESRHVAVLHKGRLYKVPVYSERTTKLLTPLQLYGAFRGILGPGSADEGFLGPRSESTVAVASPMADHAGHSQFPATMPPPRMRSSRWSADVLSVEAPDGTKLPPSHFLPALTSMDRTTWSQVREEFFVNHPHNAPRLEAIEKAVIVVCLDDESPADGDLSAEGRQYMCGNSCNRWSDKSFNVVITKNGKLGLHAEHSWGDAPALAHILERVSLYDVSRDLFDESGAVAELPEDRQKTKGGTRPLPVYPAERLDFDVSPALLAIAQRAAAEYQERINRFRLHVEPFYGYGKGFVSKKAKCSPDAWIQMAMQLTYNRDQKMIPLTYESSMTRLFAEGRTETIRSVSMASKKFVLAWDDPSVPKAEKLKLLRAACEHHQHTSHEAMVGRGVDRHLFALYVVSVYLGIESPFLQRAMGRQWCLSTSQVPPQQESDAMHAKYTKPITGDEHEFISPMGGFGPVVDTGYGVCYNLWPNAVFFNVSATRVPEATTDPRRFAQGIFAALREMQALVVEVEGAAAKPAAKATA